MRRSLLLTGATALMLAISPGLSTGALAVQESADDSDNTETIESSAPLSGTEDALERILREALEGGYVSLREEEGADDAPTTLAPQQDEAVAEATPARSQPAPQPIETQSPEPAETAQTERVVPAYRDIGTILESSGYDPADRFAQDEGSTRLRCADTDLFQFRERRYDWEMVPTLQNAVAGGSTATNAEGNIRLAKYYLALGFAEEAMALTRRTNDERVRTVYDMGEAVLGKVSDGNMLKRAESVCSPAAALWRAVTLIDAQPGTALFLAGSATEELQRLPEPLRVEFASRLGILAVENGQWSLARTLYDIAEATAEPHPTAVIYLKALINAYNGTDRDVAMNTIERIAQEEGPLQVKAILALSDMQPAEEGEHYPGYFRDLENVAVRLDGAPQSFTEAFMEVRLAAETGDFSRAVTIAANYRYPTMADRDTMKNTLAGLFETGLSRQNTQTRFAALNGYLLHRDFFSGTEREHQLAAAGGRAAASLGVSDIAIALIETVPASQRDDQLRRVLAASYLDEGDNLKALTLAMAALVEDGENDRMRSIAVEALDASGQDARAIAMLDEAPETWTNLRHKASVAWRAGDWIAARDAYAALLVAGPERSFEARHSIASYMTGQPGDFSALPTIIDLERLQGVLASHGQELMLMREALSDG